MTRATAIGWIGTACFSLSALPEVVQSIQRGWSDVASGTVALWLVGESAMLTYALANYRRDRILLVNYAANLLLVGVVAVYRWMPR